MSRYCMICHNTDCSNHGKNIVFNGDCWACNYLPVPTRAHRIRQMTDKEMAHDLIEMFMELCEDGVPSEEYIFEWLQNPAEEE